MILNLSLWRIFSLSSIENTRLNETFNEQLHEEITEIPRKFLPTIKDYKRDKEKQRNLELKKEKVNTIETSRYLQKEVKQLKTLT